MQRAVMIINDSGLRFFFGIFFVISVCSLPEDRRPLGFLRSTFYYQTGGDSGNENPCFSATGLSGREVEIRFQTVPKMKLCYRDQRGESRCEENDFEQCGPARANEMQYTFYCDVSDGCSESDVNFWVRITTGPPPEEDREMMWCTERISQYPESLRPLPTGFTPPPTRPAVGDTGLSLRASLLSLSLAILITSLF